MLSQETGNLVGQEIGGYRLKRLIGTGGFAEVYEGEDVENKDIIAAVKVLLHARLSPKEQTRFRREAQIIGRLKHPHIIDILDVGVQDRVPFMVMSYAEGGSVRNQYAAGSRLPLDVIVSYMKQVAGALQYAHDQKVIHCDIKPLNMLLKQDPTEMQPGEQTEILLCDFGVSVIMQTDTYQTMLRTQEMGITPPYMAPEQLAFEQSNLSPAVDQYALGIVVYEWLCGVPPFQGAVLQLFNHHKETPPPPLVGRVRGVTPEMQQVLFKALAKNPVERYPCVTDFATDFERACEKGPLLLPDSGQSTVITAPPPGPAQPPADPSLTRRRFLQGLGVGAIAGATVSGGGVYLLLPPKTIVRTVLGSHSPTATPPHSPAPSTPLHPMLLVTYKGHTNEVASVAWSPDGKRIASGARDRFVQVWDSSSGNRIYTYQGHKAWIFGVLWSHNGQRIASASSDDTVQIWNATTGGDVLRYTRHRAAVTAIAWSPDPDGKYIASGSVDKSVQLWDAASGVKITEFADPAEIDAVTFSPDGKYIAFGGVSQKVQIWEAATHVQVQIYSGHTAGIDTVAWSPNGKYIASGGVDKTVQVWEATTGNIVTNYQGHSDRVRSVSWSPDSTLIASASADASVRIWNVATSETLFTYSHINWVHTVAFSPDGTYLASASADKTVQVWKLK